MSEFKPGTVLQHKATLKRCVVIRQNEDGTVKVRDEDNAEQEYFPQELEEQGPIAFIV